MNSSNPKGIRPYYIGLGAVAIFVLVILVIVVFQGLSGRKDVLTAQKATEIADKLNTYTQDGSNVPSSLSSLDIKHIPSTITYKKLADDSYKFCATYKSGGNNVSVNGLEQGFSQLGGSVTNPGLAGSTSLYDTSTNSDPSYLDVSTHHKGENCQTITTYTNSSTPYNGSGGQVIPDSSSGATDPCVYPGDSSSSADFQKYQDCENNFYNNTTNTTTTTKTPTTKT
jgi:hypothetical protein